MKILYLTSRLPIPPLVKGDILRDFYIIKELASRGHKVTLVSFYRKNENNNPYLEVLKQYCEKIELIRFDIVKQSLNLIRGIYSLEPFQILLYKSKDFQNKVSLLIHQEKFDIIYTHFARLAGFVLEYNFPKIIDLQDSFEKNMRDRTLKEKNPIVKLIAFIEARRMKLYEKRILQAFSYATVVSERDLNPEHKNMFVVPNGIQDLKTIQERSKKTNGLLFMGNMSYFPNEDAALFLIREVMPIISKKIPNLKLYIVGSNPHKRLQKYNSQNVVITGFVPDMYPYLTNSRIAVAPLRYGTGIQNKVLDAMIVGIPQIVSIKAAEGFNNLSGEEFLISECEKQQLAEKIIYLWNDFALQEQLVNSGRKYVLSNYSWSQSVSMLEELFRISVEKNNVLSLVHM